jgi:hypothetical protein
MGNHCIRTTKIKGNLSNPDVGLERSGSAMRLPNKTPGIEETPPVDNIIHMGSGDPLPIIMNFDLIGGFQYCDVSSCANFCFDRLRSVSSARC